MSKRQTRLRAAIVKAALVAYEGVHALPVGQRSAAALFEQQVLHAAVVDVEAADAAEDLRILEDEVGIEVGVPDTPPEEASEEGLPATPDFEPRSCELCGGLDAAKVWWGDVLCEACADCQMPDRD